MWYNSGIIVRGHEKVMEKLAFLTNELCLLHKATYDHPESPVRLEKILSFVRSVRFTGDVHFIESSAAPIETVAEVHPFPYLERLRKACENGNYWFDFEDTFINKHSFDAALSSAGAAVEGIELLMEGEFRRVFCAVRPPGHHAEMDRGMGFCLLNNVAIAARHAKSKWGTEKIMIIDLDVHHGNGTQHIFEEDPSVFYISIHEHPTFIFPGTGRRWETGKGKGKGYTLNIPLPPGAGDEDYIHNLTVNILPYIKKYKPDLLIVSAGFDAHLNDPLADMRVTEEGFYEMTRRIAEAAGEVGNIPILSVLEGGYELESLVRSVEKHLYALMGKPKEEPCS